MTFAGLGHVIGGPVPHGTGRDSQPQNRLAFMRELFQPLIDDRPSYRERKRNELIGTVANGFTSVLRAAGGGLEPRREMIVSDWWKHNVIELLPTDLAGRMMEVGDYYHA